MDTGCITTVVEPLSRSRFQDRVLPTGRVSQERLTEGGRLPGGTGRMGGSTDVRGRLLGVDCFS